MMELLRSGEGDTAHGEQKNVGEQKRDADSDEKLIECGQARSQTLGRESVEGDGGRETDEGPPRESPKLCCQQNAQRSDGPNDAKEPRTGVVNGACKNRNGAQHRSSHPRRGMPFGLCWAPFRFLQAPLIDAVRGSFASSSAVRTLGILLAPEFG